MKGGHPDALAVVDYAGAASIRVTRPKVFKLVKLSLEGRESIAVAKSVSLAQMSTRTHYPGRHRIELLVNGAAFALGDFRLAG